MPLSFCVSRHGDDLIVTPFAQVKMLLSVTQNESDVTTNSYEAVGPWPTLIKQNITVQSAKFKRACNV